MKLAFAAPASFLPSLPTAPASQHFRIELVLAAPVRALPSLLTAFAVQAAPSCAKAGEATKSESVPKTKRYFIALPRDLPLIRCSDGWQLFELKLWQFSV